MRIAFDATAIYGSKDRGIGKYTISHINEITKTYPEDEFFYFNPYGTPHMGTYLTPRANFREVIFEDGVGGIAARKNEAYAGILGGMIHSFIDRYAIDVFYVTCPFPCWDGQVYRKEWFGNALVAATAYDLIPMVFSERYLTDATIRQDYTERCDAMRWMDHLFAISRNAKDDLCHYLNFDEKKISVIWGAADERFRPVSYTEKEARDIRKKFHISDPFIMCTGGDDERKNIGGLIEGFAKLPDALKKAYQVVVVCKLSGPSMDHYKSIARENGVAGRVILTNFVSDEEQLLLYNLSSIQAFVSKYEGLGLPVLEAYQCKKPVVTANNSSLVQIGGDAAFIADADDAQSIADALEKALTISDEERALRQQKADRMIAETFNCGFMARTTMDQLRLMVKEKHRVKSLAYFTPLPPLQSGISDFGEDVIRELAPAYDRIHVIIDEGYTPSCKLPENVKAIPHTEFQAEQYDEILYQFGNSEFHQYMLPYIEKYSGVVELHDVNCHGLALYMRFKSGSLEEYKKILQFDYSGKETDELILRQEKEGIYPERAILNGFVVHNASRIIVHSEFARNLLLRRNVSRDIAVIPHYSKVSPLPDPLKDREELHVGKKDVMIAAFGIVHETKRITPALRAMGRLAREGAAFKVVLVGKTLDKDYDTRLKNLVKEVGLKDRFHITGYTDLDVFQKYMDISDICLNLRYPYNGENSGSLARLLSKGKCTLVNRIGSFAEVPEDACVMLPSVEQMTEEEEVDRIYLALKEMLDDPAKRAAIGEKAYAYACRELDLTHIGQQYIRVLDQTPKRELTEETLCHFTVNEVAKAGNPAEAIDKLSDLVAFIKGAKEN